MDRRHAFGKSGEDLACAELTRHGYAILDRRFRTRCGELDIVARDGEVVVFVEVKARTGCNFGLPAESITWKKRQRLSAMAESYLLRRHLAGVPCRFDVVSILHRPDGHTIELFKGAFDMEVRRQ